MFQNGHIAVWIIFLLLLALLLVLLWQPISLHILNQQLMLNNSSMAYNDWIRAPIPIYMEIYLWNWTNSKNVHNKSVKPMFVECGPYVFKEFHERVDLDWHIDNDTISFNQTRTWFFDAKRSNGSLDDLITNVNVMTTATLYTIRDCNILTRKTLNYLIKNKSSLFITKTVRELLFDGYEDSLLDFIRKTDSLPPFIKNTFPHSRYPFNKVGWFVERNQSSKYDGRFNMYTGQNDISRMGIVTSWNGQQRIPFYKNTCAVITGTTGEIWPPNINQNKSLNIFVSDVCRPLPLTYESELDYYGVMAKRWIGDEKMFDNGIKYSENACFCTNKAKLCPDLKPGVLNISDCRYGAPLFVSYPHFYLADKSYLNSIDGLTPNKSLHQFSIDIEPTTGIPMHINARLQINILLEPVSGFGDFDNITKMMVPMFWFRQTVSIPKNLAQITKLAIILPSIGKWIAYGFMTISITFGLIFAYTKLNGVKNSIQHTRFENEQ